MEASQYRAGAHSQLPLTTDSFAPRTQTSQQQNPAWVPAGLRQNLAFLPSSAGSLCWTSGQSSLASPHGSFWTGSVPGLRTVPLGSQIPNMGNPYLQLQPLPGMPAIPQLHGSQWGGYPAGPAPVSGQPAAAAQQAATGTRMGLGNEQVGALHQVQAPAGQALPAASRAAAAGCSPSLGLQCSVCEQHCPAIMLNTSCNYPGPDTLRACRQMGRAKTAVRLNTRCWRRKCPAQPGQAGGCKWPPEGERSSHAQVSRYAHSSWRLLRG